MDLLKRFFKIFTRKEKEKLVLFQFFVIFVAFIEIIGFSALAPFLSFIGNPSIILENKYSSWLYHLLNFEKENQFIIFWGILTASSIIFSNIMIMLREYINTTVSLKLKRSLSLRLIRYYLQQDYMFLVNRNSNKLINNFQQLGSVIDNMLFSMLNGIGRIFLIIFFLVGIIVVDPLLGLVLNFGFSAIYLFFFYYFRKKNIKASYEIAKTDGRNFVILSECFHGIKDILISHLAPIFVRQYRENLERSMKSQKVRRIIVIAPRYSMEGILFATLTLFILLMYTKQGDNFVTIITKLSFVAIAGYKIMPKLSELYRLFTAFQGGVGSLSHVENDLVAAKYLTSDKVLIDKTENLPILDFTERILLKDIRFEYKKNHPVLKGVDLELIKNKTLGIVGTTGTGKTTLVNILLGLLTPKSGKLSIDGNDWEWDQIGSLQRLIGYVPQDIFLIDNTIEKNIAFGIEDKDINKDKVIEVLKMSALWEHVEKMPEGIDTIIGEAGIQLSGGQRQRLGIARALYRGAEILVFDEATSSLDANTEKQIMNAIDDISNKRTIVIIAHRINTLKKADNIIILKDGVVAKTGSYEELINSNSDFQRLAGFDELET